VLDSVVGVLRAHGAEIIDPVELADADKMGEPEFLALRHEFKDDLSAYLRSVDGSHPKSLAELIEFNNAHADSVLVHFGQQIFEQAEATGGRSDEKWATAREDAKRLATSGLDGAITEHRLDAVLALSGNPAWLTDYVLGDHYSIGTSSPAAVSGYPSITVPAGKVSGLPVGISLIGPTWSEPRLIALAHAFEVARG
jgi:amidase